MSQTAPNGQQGLWSDIGHCLVANHFQSFYQSKEAKTKPVDAIKALGNKLSRASYYIMRNQVTFDEDKLLR